MDSDSTITSLFLALAVLAFAALHGGETVLRRVHSSEIKRLLPERGVASFAVQHLRASSARYHALFGILQLTSVAASSALALLLLFEHLSVDWPIILGGMTALWVGLVLLRPLAVTMVQRIPASAVPRLALAVMVVLALLLPLARAAQLGRRFGPGGTEVPMGAPGAATAMESDVDEEMLDPRVRGMMRAIPRLHETAVREIMVPRVDIEAVDVESPLEQAIKQALGSGHSRLPVYEETIDKIVGVLYARDLLKATVHPSNGEVTLRDLLRPTFFVPESKRVDDLLQEFQQRHVQMAVVVDEYGGVAGMVTIEDLLEEIVGEIEDEFDATEPTIQALDNEEAVVDARIPVDTFNEAFATNIGGEGFDTLGGFLYSHLGKIPTVGDLVQVDGLHIEVMTTLGRRIKKVRVRTSPAPQEGDGPASTNEVDEPQEGKQPV